MSATHSDLENLVPGMSALAMTPTATKPAPEIKEATKIRMSGSKDLTIGQDIRCVICMKLGRVLDCCKSVQGPCSICAEFHHLLNRELTHEHEQNEQDWQAYLKLLEEERITLQEKPEKRRQETEDHIESLKQQTQEAEEAEKRLDKILQERKDTLRRLQAEQRAREPAQEYTIKVAKKGKKGKKKNP